MTFALSFGLYKGIIDNYLAEVAGMSEFDKGVSEFFRELPGLGIILVLAVFYTASAAKLLSTHWGSTCSWACATP